ncbi:hypothetical protein PVAND_004108 [Polypedilum vanderplanki]|uniref:BZIP domain-containing protein n=1 Tax=Polypedilum vanderplanki TaxID=319348 RepID=A0A9J6BX51_POLVA|nr:hypothetical protein PVAND_004108 [Polypedilum vanderplanki]
MYNFNTSLSTPLMGVGVDFCSNTPRTPEILNSLIAMTNPFEYSYSSASQSQSIPSTASIMNVDTSPAVIACKTEDSFMNQFDTSSSSSSLESPSTTPLHMTSTFCASTTPSLQQTRSQLIKAGVKLLIQNKRKNSGSSNFDFDCKPPPLKIRPTTLSSSSPITTRLNSSSSIPSSSDTVPSPTSILTSPKQEKSPISVRSFPIKTDSTTSCDEEDSEPKPTVNSKNLTPEDEDRRRRRRERNKIAATKCRLKKRECINNLMRESETLEAQNVDLKTQLKSLEEEYKYLSDMWQSHQLECKSMALLGTTTTTHEQNNNSNANIASLIDEIEMIKDTNNNKHLNNNQDQISQQLPSLTPLINCNVSFDFY